MQQFGRGFLLLKLFLYALLGSFSAVSIGADNPSNSPQVETTTGSVRGSMEGDIAVFRGIPFAARPVGNLRFRAPQPMPRWNGVRDATQFGPMCPQRPSRLAPVMGEYNHPQAEDNCLTLNVWAPKSDGERHPVLVWIHGGGGVTGSGRLGWYSGLTFARNGRLVVVTINYRLGPLGLMYLPGVADGNMTALDQRMAMRWVKDNIGQFGGDPNNITVAGQSGGGRAVVTLLASSENDGLFRRAILQSPAIGSFLQTPEQATARALEYVKILGLSKPEDILRVPTDQLLTAYSELIRRNKRFANPSLPFSAVLDGRVYQSDPTESFVKGNGMRSPVDLLIGTTRDESAGHFAFDNDVLNATDAQVRERFKEVFGEKSIAYVEEYRRMLPQAKPFDLLVHLGADIGYLRGSLAIAEAQAKRGSPAYLYRFDWESPVDILEATHCLELPFVFNNFDEWRDAPMLQGADPEEMHALAAVIHQAWINFVKTGDPNHDRLPPWTPYVQETRITMRFDRLVEPVGDLAGVRWRQSLAIAGQ